MNDDCVAAAAFADVVAAAAAAVAVAVADVSSAAYAFDDDVVVYIVTFSRMRIEFLNKGNSFETIQILLRFSLPFFLKFLSINTFLAEFLLRFLQHSFLNVFLIFFIF